MYVSPISVVLYVLLLSTSVASIVHDSVSSLSSLTYDFIVVGGGTAGNVIANRLSASGLRTVLVLEAGASNAGPIATPPLLAPTLAPNTQFDWNYTTTPQPGFGGRSIPYPRGFVLGGSSSINYMVYTRGSSDDYDRYASMVGDSGISWDNIQPYIRLSEDFVAPNDNHFPVGQFNPAVHSTLGAVSVSVEGFSWPPDPKVIATTQDPSFSAEYPFNLDMNSGKILGVGWTQATIGRGQRSSSATAYLTPSVINRPNLDVLLNARVTRAIQTGSSNGYPVFQAVEFSNGTSSSAPRFVATARHEIIICGGSFNTPQILMLSGIGPEAELAALGIKTVVDNPSVGKNMSDHALLANPWTVNSNMTFETFLRDPSTLQSQLTNWQKTGMGPLSYTITNQLGWFRLPDNSIALQTTPDPSAGPGSSHYELIWASGFSVPGQSLPAAGNYMTIFTNVISPTSRGTVTLQSSDPFEAPLINPNFLGTDFDNSVMVTAIRAAQRFVTASAWAGFIKAPFGAFADAYNGTDAQLDAYARDNSGSVWHACGTASMGPTGDDTWGVVDPHFRVKGQLGLRAVDASVIPIVPNAHTSAPVYIFAERAADVILQDWSLINTILDLEH